MHKIELSTLSKDRLIEKLGQRIDFMESVDTNAFELSRLIEEWRRGLVKTEFMEDFSFPAPDDGSVGFGEYQISTGAGSAVCLAEATVEDLIREIIVIDDLIAKIKSSTLQALAAISAIEDSDAKQQTERTNRAEDLIEVFKEPHEEVSGSF